MPDRLAWDWLGSIADVTSLVMLPITAYAAWKVRSLSAKVSFNVRAPRTLDRIEQLACRIEALLRSEKYDQHEVVSLISRCEAEIDTLRKGVSGEADNAARTVKSLLKEYSQGSSLGDDPAGVFWAIFSAISRFTVHARHLHAERLIGASNDSE